ncbi:AEC family transporter [Shewanella gelidimarina]|uniref:AEC family transporter n=1 Tax=Shewanella gelidimarina TaxID=56813 RepID=UPI00200F6016|nr:AEC family transporter [Shewanella gelidimarina]MCL1057976.1 AEC family transporter [Shewanella gelidimarina]
MVIISIVFPLIFMAVLGYVLTTKSVFSKEQISGISLFTFYLSIPAFLFINMVQADLSKSFDIKALACFYLPVLAAYGIGVALYCFLRKGQSKLIANASAYGLGCSYSNTILVGLPIIVGALGQEMMGNVFVIITFHSALLFSLTFMLALREEGAGVKCWPFIKGIVLNPIVMSISLGLLLNILHIPLYENVVNGINLLSQPALACALFVLGANLSFYKIAKDWKLALLASLVKLLVLPALVYALGLLFKLEQQLLAVLVLLSASPLGINAYLVAMQVKAQQTVIASTVVLSTVLCVFSMSFWLAILL